MYLAANNTDMEKIVWLSNKHEDIGTEFIIGLEYSFLSTNNCQLIPFVHCREYLHDTIQGALHKINRRFANFSYIYNQDKPFSFDKLRMLVGSTHERNFPEKLTNAMHFLWKAERILDLPKTTLQECPNPPWNFHESSVWLLEASNAWLSAPPMISMYSLLLRIGLVYNGDSFFDTIDDIVTGKVKPYRRADKRQLVHGAFDAICYIISQGHKELFGGEIINNYPIKLPMRTFHLNYGLMGFWYKNAKKCKHWYKNDNRQ